MSSTRHYFAFQRADGSAIPAMGQLEYDPCDYGDKARSLRVAKRMAQDRGTLHYYGEVAVVDVKTTYEARKVATYRKEPAPARLPL
jgi:hypothetical protein